MAIVRGVKDRRFNFVQLLNSLFEDQNLSLKSKGFIGFCLTKAENWEFHISHLRKVLKEGEDAIYSTINECIKNGYALRYQDRGPDGRMLPVEFIISDSKTEISTLLKEYESRPGFKKSLPDPGNSGTGSPGRNSPGRENPDAVIPSEIPSAIYNNTNSSNTEEQQHRNSEGVLLSVDQITNPRSNPCEIEPFPASIQKKKKQHNIYYQEVPEEAVASCSGSPSAPVVSSSSLSKKKKKQVLEKPNPENPDTLEALKAAEQYAESERRRGNPVNLIAIRRKAIKEGWKLNETKESLEAKKNKVLEEKQKIAEDNRKRITQIIKKIDHCFGKDFMVSSESSAVFIRIGRGNEVFSYLEEDFMKKMESFILPMLDEDVKETVRKMFK